MARIGPTRKALLSSFLVCGTVVKATAQRTSNTNYTASAVMPLFTFQPSKYKCSCLFATQMADHSLYCCETLSKVHCVTVTLQNSSHTNRRPLQSLFVRHTNDRLSGSCLQYLPSCSLNALNMCAPPQCFAWRNNFLSLRSMVHVFLHSMFQAVCSLCFEAYTHTFKPNST